MILTRNEILKAVQTGEIVIDPFEESALGCNANALIREIKLFIAV